MDDAFKAFWDNERAFAFNRYERGLITLDELKQLYAVYRGSLDDFDEELKQRLASSVEANKTVLSVIRGD